MSFVIIPKTDHLKKSLTKIAQPGSRWRALRLHSLALMLYIVVVDLTALSPFPTSCLRKSDAATPLGIGCTGLYWAVMDSSGLYCTGLGCSGLCCTRLGCNGLDWAVMDGTGLYWDVLGCNGLYCAVMGSSWLYSTGLGCIWLYCTGQYWTVLYWTWLYGPCWTRLGCKGLYLAVMDDTGLYLAALSVQVAGGDRGDGRGWRGYPKKEKKGEGKILVRR